MSIVKQANKGMKVKKSTQADIRRVNLLDDNTVREGMLIDGVVAFNKLNPAIQNSMSDSWQNWVGEPYDDQPSSAANPRGLNFDDLKVSFSFERVTIDKIRPIEGEKDDNKRLVWEIIAPQKDKRCRMMGTWNTQTTSNGTRTSIVSPPSGYTDMILSITFVGTGLNILHYAHPTARLDCDIYVDGVDSGNDYSSTGLQGIGGGRNVDTNTVFNLVSGLSYGVHTVELIPNNANGSRDIHLYGFEVITIDSDELKCRAGDCYIKNQKVSKSVVTSWANPDGTQDSDGVTVNSPNRGAKVLECLDEDGNRKFYTTNTDNSHKYFNNTDHSNEEVQKYYNWRSFGVGRGDDFSQLFSTSDHAFTMDDNLTSLVCEDCTHSSAGYSSQDCLRTTSSSSRIYFTFVGTGVDIVFDNPAGATPDSHSFSVDNGTYGSWSGGMEEGHYIRPVCSQAPYGTHVLSISRGASTSNHAYIAGFIVYENKTPKFVKLNKPTDWESTEGYWDLPDNVIPLTIYNILADWNANTFSTNPGQIARGIIRHHCLREFTFGGTGFVISSPVDSAKPGGFQVYSPTSGDYIEFQFYGTGFDFRFHGHATSDHQVNVKIDGANYTGAATAYGSGITWTPASSYLDQAGVAGDHNCGFYVTGLTLGLHTVRFTCSGASNMRVSCIDIITPIHHSQFPLPNRNTTQSHLQKGNCAVQDLRVFTPVKGLEEGEKRWAVATGITSTPSVTATYDIPMADMSINWYSDGKKATRVHFQGSMRISASPQYMFLSIWIDGKQVPSGNNYGYAEYSSAASADDIVSFEWIGLLPKGYHQIAIYWRVAANTGYNREDRRALHVHEI